MRTRLSKTERIAVAVDGGPIVTNACGHDYRVTAVRIERTWWPDSADQPIDEDTVFGRPVGAPPWSDPQVVYLGDDETAIFAVLRAVAIVDIPPWLMARVIAAECQVSIVDAQAAIDETHAGGRW